MKYHIGLSCGFHDAGLTVISGDGEIRFASHSERYSKKKNDANLCPELVEELWGHSIGTIAYYERPWLKQLRQWRSGQGIEWNKLTVRQILKQQIGLEFAQFPGKITTHNHHLCHAAAGFQTSPYDRATVVVIDAIGEFDTISIWGAKYDSKGQATYKRLWGQTYPHSIGLFYSAITQRVGLHPLDEEYITMGMSAWGRPVWYENMHYKLIADDANIEFRDNLHLGLDANSWAQAKNEDLAASAQLLTETLIGEVMARARGFGWSTNLVYMGGCAMNSLANQDLVHNWDKIWSLPNPGDPSSAIGSVLYHKKYRVNWQFGEAKHIAINV